MCSMTSQGSPYQRFRRALATGNPTIVRAAAAELPRIGIAEAAAILLVLERADPEHYERAALRWLTMLTSEARNIDLHGVAEAALALAALPAEPGALGALAEVCSGAGLAEAAAVFRPPS